MANYPIDPNPVYNNQIRMIEDTDPVKASEITNPVINAMINNAEANKNAIGSNSTALASKVDKVEGKDLSSNDFTGELKAKLDSIEINANDYVLPDDVVKNPGEYATTGGTGNAYMATIDSFLSLDGTEVKLKMHAANAANATLSINGNTSAPIKNTKGENLKDGDIAAGAWIKLVWDGVSNSFFMLGGSAPALTGNATAGDVLLGKTFYSNDANTRLTGIKPAPMSGSGLVINNRVSGNITIAAQQLGQTSTPTSQPLIALIYPSPVSDIYRANDWYINCLGMSKYSVGNIVNMYYGGVTWDFGLSATSRAYSYVIFGCTNGNSASIFSRSFNMNGFPTNTFYDIGFSPVLVVVSRDDRGTNNAAQYVWYQGIGTLPNNQATAIQVSGTTIRVDQNASSSLPVYVLAYG